MTAVEGPTPVAILQVAADGSTLTAHTHLTDKERAMLDGQANRALQRAMQIVVTLARIYGAPRLIPVTSVQVAGVSYRNLGEAGLEFLRDWAAQGAQVQVPTTLNPAGMDLVAWQRMRISEGFARKQQETVEVYKAMGILPTCTCTPYLVGNAPGLGEHIAWSESSAVVYANSVLGARSNREGGPSALAAAISGRTGAFGLHLDQNRLATHRVRVRCAVREPHEFAALGYVVGKRVGDGVPYLEGLELPALGEGECAPHQAQEPMLDKLKLMGAAMASSGAVALYHVAGVTPEALLDKHLCSRAVTVQIDSLEPAWMALNSAAEEIELVVIGCPHASLDELRQVSEGLRGHHIRSALWVTVSRQVRERGEALGLVQAIEEAGGLVVADGCVIVAPMSELPYRTLATNSAKMASYALPHAGLQVRFGSLEQCLRAATTGRWEWSASRSQDATRSHDVPPGPTPPISARDPIPLGAPAVEAVANAPALACEDAAADASTPAGALPFSLRGRVIVGGRGTPAGTASGIALVSDRPISFLGGVDPASGMIIEPGHPLQGCSVAGRVLVFPTGKGSTVGSYVIYRLAKAGLAPAAIINRSSEPIVAVGALIAGILMIDLPESESADISRLKTGMRVVIEGEVVHFG